MIRGSYYGWLITIRLDGIMRMFNPFTRAQFFLPPLSTFPGVIDYQPENHGIEYTLQREKDGMIGTSDNVHMQKAHVEKIIISSPPNHDNLDFMAIAIYGEFSGIAYCSCNDNKWIKIVGTKIQYYYQDVIFHEGKIYAIDHKACLFKFEMKTMPSSVGGIIQAPPPVDLIIGYTNEHNKYVIGTPHGILMVIRRLKCYYKVLSGKEKKYCYKTTRFKIYKMNTLLRSLYGHDILISFVADI